MDDINEEYLQVLSAYDSTTGLGNDVGGVGQARFGSERRYPVSVSLAAAYASGERGRICVLCAEPGMGRTTLLAEAMDLCSAAGDHTRFVDMTGVDAPQSIDRCGEIARWVRKEIAAGNQTAIAIDNLPCGDEADAERQVRVLRALLRLGANVYVATLPEAEMMIEMLGEATVYWSSNLRIARSHLQWHERLHCMLTQGVPALVEAFDRACGAGLTNASDILKEPGYQQVYADVVTASIRREMMGEEAMTRVAMILLGQGELFEVERIVGKVDADLWRSLARDAPLFGIDVARESFSCAGSAIDDGLGPIHAWLSDVISVWPKLSSDVVGHLAARGDCHRAALVGKMCPDGEDRIRVILEWAPELVDAGELGLVEDGLSSARANGLTDLPGFAEALCLSDALSKPRRLSSLLVSVQEETRQARDAAMMRGLRSLLAGRQVDAGLFCASANDTLGDALALCGRALAFMVDGRLEDAFVLLVDAPSRATVGSLVSTFLEMEYVFCSLLMGIVPPARDFALLDAAHDLLEHSQLPLLIGMAESLLPFCSLLGGHKLPAESFDAQITRAARMGDTMLQGMYLMGAALIDARERAYVRAHVRLGQASAAFESSHRDSMAKIARLLDICVRIELSERVPRVDISSCKGAGKAFDKAVTIVLAATARQRGKRPVGAGHWDVRVCPRDIHWLLNLLMGDFGDLSQRVREVTPNLWRESVDRDSAGVDAAIEDWATANGRSAWDKPAVQDDIVDVPTEYSVSGTDDKCVQINVLGGMQVRAGGKAVGNTALERRRAKSMLALLAAIPGHVAKRFTIMESVWPEYDYDTAHRCVYSATSVLRTEICGALGDEDATSVVFSNRSDRTVLLDMDLVSCDVDAFEEKAHRVLDNAGDDRLIVALCREIEDLYRGPLFVPPTDGAGIVGARARELQGLYADAMVAGAEAAMRTDMKTVACRFARKAHEGDDMREDAVRVLMIALCEAGRQVEAEQIYERYVSHVVDVTRRPPSRGLRKVAGQLLGEQVRDKISRRRQRLQEALPEAEHIDEDAGGLPSAQLRLDFDDGKSDEVANA